MLQESFELRDLGVWKWHPKKPRIRSPLNTPEQTICWVRRLHHSQSRILGWLEGSLNSHTDMTEARRIVNLISLVDDPETYPPPSKQYDYYSNEVTRIMADLGTEMAARQFLIDTYLLSQGVSVPPVTIFYPPLREYVRHYHKTPELLVTLYDYSSSVGEAQSAANWLVQAHQLEPENEYVTWQRLLSRGDPMFPRELIHSNNQIEEEKWLLYKLLKQKPYDPLALGVKSYIDKTNGPLNRVENITFLNSLRRVAPLPMRQIGLLDMIRPRMSKKKND